MIFIAFIFSFYAEFIIGVVFGDEFKTSGNVLKIYAYTCLPVGLGVAMKLWAINEGKNVVFVYNTVIATIANILLNYIYIPKYGAVGASFASLLAQFMSGFLLNIIFAKELFKMQFLGFILRFK